ADAALVDAVDLVFFERDGEDFVVEAAIRFRIVYGEFRIVDELAVLELELDRLASELAGGLLVAGVGAVDHENEACQRENGCAKLEHGRTPGDLCKDVKRVYGPRTRNARTICLLAACGLALAWHHASAKPQAANQWSRFRDQHDHRMGSDVIRRLTQRDRPFI